MRIVTMVGSTIVLTFFFLTSGFAQSTLWQDNFDRNSRGYWPDWIEVAKPACGAQPRVINGMGFLFVNGCNSDPMLNREHLLFADALDAGAAVSEVATQFKFTNSANGGKLLSQDGRYMCLGAADVMSFVTNELMMVTLNDDGDSWYGAFIGDYRLLRPDYVPSPDASAPQSYSTIGLVRKSAEGFKALSVVVIPSVRRFSAINCTVKLNTPSASNDVLTATFKIQNAETYTLSTEADPYLAPTGRQTGILYLVGEGSPCTNLPQREVAVDHFRIRSGF